LLPQWTIFNLVILTTPTTVKFNRIPQWQHLSRIKHCPPTSDSSTTKRMSTLAYRWAPYGYSSPANSFPLPLLHKLLFLIWLLNCFPFATQESSSYGPCTHIARTGCMVTKTLLFLCRLCYRVMHSQSHYPSSVLPW
jgi:hypothetical protein